VGTGLAIRRPTKLADAVPPLPPCVDVTAPVTLLKVPSLVTVNFKANVQLAIAGRVATERLTLLEFATAVMLPPHTTQ
jgi:hypothetical protein